jgi:MraZ protein
MSGMFLGKHTISVNKQKWITIPTGLKKKFAPSARMSVVVTWGFDNNLVIYPLDNWQDKLEELRNGNERDRKLRSNLLEFASQEQKLDSAGRIKIDDDHLLQAGISESVVLKGNGRFITIWTPEAYSEYLKKRMTSHSEMFDAEDYQ